MVVRNTLFRNIDAHAINIRGNVSSAQILDNQFFDIVNSRSDGSAPRGGFAIRLGESSDGSNHHIFSTMTHHRIERNLIRGMRKSTSNGNLIGLLLYGNYHLVRENVFENIDGTSAGLDVNAMYIRGAHNRIIGNTIRNVRGADDDGALAFKGGLDLGSVHNVIAHNRIEEIHGMSAIEVSSTDLHLHDNVVRRLYGSGSRVFYQRGGDGVLMENNDFEGGYVRFRGRRGTVTVRGNTFRDGVWLRIEENASGTDRDAVYIRENHFLREHSTLRTIGLAGGVHERLVSIVGNTFRASGSASHEVDLVANGTVRSYEWRNNTTHGSFRLREP
jgi:hypothetical protein